MSRRTNLRAASVALVASTGVAVVTAVGPAAAVTPNTDPPVASSDYSLSIALSQRSIDLGSSDTVSGVLTKAGAPQAGDTVYLRARPAGRHRHAHRVGSGTTGADGSVSFTVTPTRDTRYRLVFRGASSGTPTSSPSPVPSPVSRSRAVARSKVAVVHVVRPTSLSIGAGQTRRGEAIRGWLRSAGHGLPGRRVLLQERAVGSDSWTPVATKRTHRHGEVTFRITAPPVPEEYQLVFAGGPRYHASHSDLVTIG